MKTTGVCTRTGVFQSRKEMMRCAFLSSLPPSSLPWCPSKAGPLGPGFSVLLPGEADPGQEGQMGLLAEMLLNWLFLVPPCACQCFGGGGACPDEAGITPCRRRPVSQQASSGVPQSSTYLLRAVSGNYLVTPVLHFTHQLSLKTVI